MKRIPGWLLLAFVVLICGCGSRQQEKENSYTIYYMNTTGTRLMENSYSPGAQTFEEMMDELWTQLLTPPSGYTSVVPAEVTFNGYERGIDALRMDFSKEYYDLSNIEEVLLRAAVVKTFSQVPGVTKVMITVEKEQLKGAEGDPVPAMDVMSFIDTKEGGINSYQYATLELYFANADGDQLIGEMRNVNYSSNMVLERVVVEQLINGPESKELNPIFAGDVRIQNLYIQNGICTINFNEAANQQPAENPPDADTALYAIVNSICATCDDISGVRIEIEGNNDAKFRGEMDLDQVFMMNRGFIEVNEMQTEERPVSAEAPAAAEEAAETELQSDIGVTRNPVIGIDPAVPD